MLRSIDKPHLSHTVARILLETPAGVQHSQNIIISQVLKSAKFEKNTRFSILLVLKQIYPIIGTAKENGR